MAMKIENLLVDPALCLNDVDKDLMQSVPMEAARAWFETGYKEGVTVGKSHAVQVYKKFMDERLIVYMSKEQINYVALVYMFMDQEKKWNFKEAISNTSFKLDGEDDERISQKGFNKIIENSFYIDEQKRMWKLRMDEEEYGWAIRKYVFSTDARTENVSNSDDENKEG